MMGVNGLDGVHVAIGGGTDLHAAARWWGHPPVLS